MNQEFSKIKYEPETGAFRWVARGPGIKPGKLAGSRSAGGYWVVKVNRIGYAAHRLAWFLSTGQWPDGEIDHINGNPLDNRLCNLRVVDRAGNSQNRWKAHSDHASCGLLGVTWNKQHRRWQAKIVANKVRHHIGYFDDPVVAHRAYMAKKAELHISGGGH